MYHHPQSASAKMEKKGQLKVSKPVAKKSAVATPKPVSSQPPHSTRPPPNVHLSSADVNALITQFFDDKMADVVASFQSDIDSAKALSRKQHFESSRALFKELRDLGTKFTPNAARNFRLISFTNVVNNNVVLCNICANELLYVIQSKIALKDGKDYTSILAEQLAEMGFKSTPEEHVVRLLHVLKDAPMLQA